MIEKSMNNRGIFSRRMALFLAIVLILTSIQIIPPKAVQAAGLSAWGVGYADGSTSNFRSSQMIMVETKGFSDMAKLSYHYYSTSTKRSFGIFHYDLISSWPIVRKPEPPKSTSGPFGIFNAISNVASSINGLLTVEDAESDSPYFAVTGTDAINMKVKIVVTDTNKNSPTYNQSVTTEIGPFEKANLTKDISAPHVMFEGETRTVPYLLATSGVGHIYPESDACATINSLSFSNVDEGTISWDTNSDYSKVNVTGVHAGLAKMNLSVTKATSCTYQPGLTGAGPSYIKVFKRPVVTPVDDGFDITNTEAGVTYVIGGQSKKCTVSGETISFRNLVSGCDYNVQCTSTLPNGMTAKASVTAKTLEPYNVIFTYLNYEGITDRPENQLIQRDNLSSASKENGPYVKGYILSDWYIDSAFENLYDFNVPVTSDMMLFGKWERMKNSFEVKLTHNGQAYTERTVELYQSGTLCYTLEENSPGNYSLSDKVYTGIYNVVVDGEQCGEYNVLPNKTAKDLSASNLAQRISGETFSVTINMSDLKVNTLLNGAPTEVGEVTYRDNNGYFSSSSYDGGYKLVVWDKDSRTFDIYHNGKDTDKSGGSDDSKNIAVSSPEKTIELYYMTLNAKIDDPDWHSDNVTMRDLDGNFVATMQAGTYDATTGVIPYTCIMQKDESSTPVEYAIYIDGVDSHKRISATVDKHTADIELYTATITVTKDGAFWNDAEVKLNNGSNSYTLSAGVDGQYKAAIVLESATQEPDYNVDLTGVIGAQSMINSQNKNLVLDCSTISYYSYIATGDGSSYELDSHIYRSQIVKKGQKIPPVSSPYVQGLTFSCWSKTPWSIDETLVDPYDFEQPVDEKISLYAHFLKPQIKINGYVKTDSDGNINGSGDYFRLVNLSINGFDEGEAIKNIMISSTNIDQISFPTSDVATVDNKAGSAVISFPEKVSMADAQVYLRNVVFNPKQEESIYLKITVSDGIIENSSDSLVTQGTCGEKWEKITAESTSGRTLTAGNYYVESNISFTNSTAGGHGLSISGTVNLYIPVGVTITATGHDAAGVTGGGAGVYLPSTATLNLYGGGELKATGGKAANGVVGGNASNAVLGGSNEWNYSFTSGAGGNGGGGAGAGIGTGGENGGKGATAATMSGYTDDYLVKKGTDGNKGNNGSNAVSASGNVGNINTYGVTITAKGGAAGTNPSGSASASTCITKLGKNRYYYGASGAGGNGSGGLKAADIGTGGAGGAGGGSGGTGGITWSQGSDDKKYRPQGGKGGNAGYSGANGTTNSDAAGGGNGGAGGTLGNNENQSSRSVGNSPDVTYKVTFDSDNSTDTIVTYYLFKDNTDIVVPDYTPDQQKFFLGWKIKTYGKIIGENTDNKPFVAAEDKLYQPGEKIRLATNTYGNIVLVPVTIGIKGKTADDSMNIANDVFKPDVPAVTYYNYKITTKLDGNNADIGNLLLMSEAGESKDIGGNGSGIYELVDTVSTTYKIYLDNIDTGVTVSANDEATVDAKTIEITTTLDGVANPNLGDVTLVSENSTLATNPVVVSGNLTGTYRVKKLSSQASSNYKIYVNGEDTGKSINFGEQKTIAFNSVKINILGNADVTNVVLKNATYGDRTLGKNGEAYVGVKTVDNDNYRIYVNGEDSGKDASFANPNTTVDIVMNNITAKLMVDGVLSDSTGLVPTYKNNEMPKLDTGLYQQIVFGSIGKVHVANDSKNFDDTQSAAFEYVRLTYDKNGDDVEGTVPVDNNYYLLGNQAKISSLKNLTKADHTFVGWKVDSEFTVYKAGDAITAIDSSKEFKAQWRENSTYPFVVIKDGETIYVDELDLKKMIEDRNYPATGDGKPGMTIIVNSSSVTLDELYLGPEDTLTIKAGTSLDVTGTFTNEGKVIVNGSTGSFTANNILNKGEIENKGSIDVKDNGTFVNDGGTVKNGTDANITVGSGATMTNQNGGTVENEGTIEIISGGTFDNKAKVINKDNGKIKMDVPSGTFTNEKGAELENNGELIVDGKIDNKGTIKNEGSIKSEVSPTGTIDNEGTINGIPSGEITVSVNNADTGAVVGGKLIAPGTISGGVVTGIDAENTDAVTGAKNDIAGTVDTPSNGGTIPIVPTQTDINTIFGVGNAEIVMENGSPMLDENGNYIIVLKNSIELKDPIVVPEGVTITIELLGNIITGPDGKTAIENRGELVLQDHIGGGKVSGGSGVFPDGAGSPAVEVTGNGKLKVNENTTVVGGSGVGSGDGGSGIKVNLDNPGTGKVEVNGNVLGGDGGSSAKEGVPSGNGGTGIEVVSAPAGAITISSTATVTGGDGGDNATGSGGNGGAGVFAGAGVPADAVGINGNISGGNGGISPRIDTDWSQELPPTGESGHSNEGPIQWGFVFKEGTNPEVVIAEGGYVATQQDKVLADTEVKIKLSESQYYKLPESLVITCGERTLIPGTDYTYTYTSAENGETNYPQIGTITLKKDVAVDTVLVIDAKGVARTFDVVLPTEQVGYILTADKSNCDYKGSVTLTFALLKEFAKQDNFKVTINGDEITLDANDEYIHTPVEKDIVVAVEGVGDVVSPKTKITFGKNVWQSFVNTISFGYFYKDKKTLNITATDEGAGVDRIYYHFSESILDESAVKTLNFSEWFVYTDQIVVNANRALVAYAKAMDKAGNVTYISSEGLVIYTDAKQITADVSYVKFCEENRTIDIALNGNTIKEIKEGNTVLVKNQDYTINTDGSGIELLYEYMQTLSKGTHTYTIIYNPFDKPYVEHSDNEAPYATEFTLNVEVDEIAPIITGIEEDGFYYATTQDDDGNYVYKIKATDNDIFTLMVDGDVITRDAEGNYAIVAKNKMCTVVAKDRTGNTTTIKAIVATTDHEYRVGEEAVSGLEAALEKAKETGKPIQVMEDVEITTDTTIDEGVVLDTNGHTVTAKDGVTLKNLGTIENENGKLAGITNAGHIIGGTIEGPMVNEETGYIDRPRRLTGPIDNYGLIQVVKATNTEGMELIRRPGSKYVIEDAYSGNNGSSGGDESDAVSNDGGRVTAGIEKLFDTVEDKLLDKEKPATNKTNTSGAETIEETEAETESIAEDISNNILKEYNYTADDVKKLLDSDSPADQSIVYDMIDEAVKRDLLVSDDTQIVKSNEAVSIGTVANENIRELAKDILTDDEMIQMLNGVPVNIWGEVNHSTFEAEDVKAAFDNKPEGTQIATIFDIAVLKQIGDQVAEKVYAVTGTFKVNYQIPEEFRPTDGSMSEYQIMRIYTDENGNVCTELIAVKQNDFTLTFQVDPNSKYVLICDEATPLANVMLTGMNIKNNCYMHWLALLIAILGMLLIYRSKKRKEKVTIAGTEGIILLVLAILGSCTWDYVVVILGILGSGGIIVMDKRNPKSNLE